MKKALLVVLLGLPACALSAAESNPQDKVATAAKQLEAKPNYSWTTSMKEADGSPSRIGSIEGKADKTGLTYLSFEVGGVPVEVFIKGQKGAAKSLEGWQTFDEVAQTSEVAAAVVGYLRKYKTPTAQSAALSGKMKDPKEADGVISGDLSEEAIKELLQLGGRRREGQEPPKIENPKGSVKFWIKDGALTKYEFNTQAKITRGEREIEVNRTTTVEIKEVGTTKLEVPDEAKQKML